MFGWAAALRGAGAFGIGATLRLFGLDVQCDLAKGVGLDCGRADWGDCFGAGLRAIGDRVWKNCLPGSWIDRSVRLND